MENNHYSIVEKAIIFIRENFQSQPTLEEIAHHVNLSPFHFQRLFQEWAGTTPKKFLQYVSVNYAKYLLKEKQWTLFETAEETGLSGTGRLHDLFIQLEGMTPAEFKKGGDNIDINFNFRNSTFGKILMASTKKGICHLSFIEDEKKALDDLYQQFPNGIFSKNITDNQEEAMRILNNLDVKKPLKLHVKGSPFQLKVWEALLKIPSGNMTSYQKIAEEIGQKNASRAVGTAIGNNPVAFLIPCHRVIRHNGELGGYMWGLPRKMTMLAWEQVQTSH